MPETDEIETIDAEPMLALDVLPAELPAQLAAELAGLLHERRAQPE